MEKLGFNLIEEILGTEEENDPGIFEKDISLEGEVDSSSSAEDRRSTTSTTTNDAPNKKESNRSQIFQDPLCFYHFNFQKPDSCFVAGDVCTYWRLELITQMDPLNFKAENILRPAGTVLRPGDEVFVCSTKRPTALGKTYIIFKIFPCMKNPAHSNVLLIEEAVGGCSD